MLKLDNISKFITFTIDLFNDEFSSYIDYVDSVYYFSNGGCYELAKIIKHYFPDAKFVMQNDYRHCGVLYEGKIYDVFDGLTKEQLEEKGIKEDEYIKDYGMAYIEGKEINRAIGVFVCDLAKLSFGAGKDIIIEGKPVDEKMIDEISKCSSVIAGKR